MKKILIAYVPVLHEGYIRFFEKHRDCSKLFIVSDEFLSEFPRIAKDIRRLNPNRVVEAIRSWGIVSDVELFQQRSISFITEEKSPVFIPREDIMLALWEKYFPKAEVFLDTVFLRWDKFQSVTPESISPENIIALNAFDQRMSTIMKEQAGMSGDWYRRVGCVVVKKSEVLVVSHNRHLPSEHTPYINGDPRSNFHKGVHIELGTSIHAEAEAIAQAAKKGISLEGSEMYVSTFPCPACAKLIACCGVSKLYYLEGYGVLDGQEVLKQAGVRIIYLDA